jgi:ferrous iron transport protein B
MVVIWFLCSIPPAPADAPEPSINYSLAGWIGKIIEPVLHPVGFNWQIDIALIPGMAARGVAVAALGTVYAIGAPMTLATALWQHLGRALEPRDRLGAPRLVRLRAAVRFDLRGGAA